MPHPILKKAQQLSTELTAIRRHLHQNPELSFQEINTTSTIVQHLQTHSNLTVHYGKDHTGLDTGVIATLNSGKRPVIAIRADIDALPIQELNDTSYKSQNDGVMHACGHDAHTAIGIGAAKILAEIFEEETIDASVKFIFQPAEEDTDEHGSTGSPYLIKAGVLDDVDAVLALHMNPEQRVGEVLLNEGNSMAAIDTFDAVLKGSGGHAAYPQLGTDPVYMLSFVLQAIQGIIARRTSPLEPAVISVTHVETSPSYNVIPSEVHIRGTIRSYNEDVRRELEEELHQALKITHTFKGDYELTVRNGEPALKNHPVVISWLAQTVKDLLPDFHIHKGPYGMGGEDFAYMTQKRPGAMFFIGAGLDEGDEQGLHMPRFDIDESVLVYGAAILAETALRYVKNEYTLPT
ncbi:M20 family metallopeptidase [Bacillus tianshenii]|nr:M20 family metallopeptidase [Bacillus tianshenii]